ncbi:MAG: hypothetical protein M1829_003928 [Trizodia sp. TS-e1964]|nr:MAG: hypothetical protein M1829_003928 [Trizodia sp. TS-e1964]
MEYLIRLAQAHETFRKPEILALAALHSIDVEFTPFCIIRVQNAAEACKLVERSILTKSVFELWGSAEHHAELQEDVRRRASALWPRYISSSFRFSVDCYQGKQNTKRQQDLINSFSWLGFKGKVKMVDPDQHFTIFEDYGFHANHAQEPLRVYFGRWLGNGARDVVNNYDLKKRKYISTTSMDAELSLITANLTLAAPHKVFYDPFVGTGSFPIACAHFGAMTIGSDIDGRSIRGTKKRNLKSNFEQYKLVPRFIDSFVADLTHCPLKMTAGSNAGGWLDGIVCDPPYGVREGLKVLGSRDPEKNKEAVMIEGEAAHLLPEYIPPKRPYSFLSMLEDILEFAHTALKVNARLSLWMPTANDDQVVLKIPNHPSLELVSNCVQPFNKWSRRLLTYRKLAEPMVAAIASVTKSTHPTENARATANELNAFRRLYFGGFKFSTPQSIE